MWIAAMQTHVQEKKRKYLNRTNFWHAVQPFADQVQNVCDACVHKRVRVRACVSGVCVCHAPAHLALDLQICMHLRGRGRACNRARTCTRRLCV
jgi:hypothetical protein